MGRYFRPFLLTLLLFAVFAWYAPIFWNKIQQNLKNLESKQDLSSSQVSPRIVYPLDAREWIKVAIPDNNEKIRIISNAHIQKVENISPDASWRYSLEYQLLSPDGKLLGEHIYHQRTRLTAYENADKPRYVSKKNRSDS